LPACWPLGSCDRLTARNSKIYRGFLDWDYPGLRTAVNVDGVMNRRDKTDRGLTAVLAFPWKGLELLRDRRLDVETLWPLRFAHPRSCLVTFSTQVVGERS